MASIVPPPFNDEEADLNMMTDEIHDQRLLIGNHNHII